MGGRIVNFHCKIRQLSYEAKKKTRFDSCQSQYSKTFKKNSEWNFQRVNLFTQQKIKTMVYLVSSLQVVPVWANWLFIGCIVIYDILSISSNVISMSQPILL